MNEDLNKPKIYAPEEVLKGLRDATTEALLSVQAVYNPTAIDGIEATPEDLRAAALALLRENIEDVATWSSRCAKITLETAMTVRGYSDTIDYWRRSFEAEQIDKVRAEGNAQMEGVMKSAWRGLAVLLAIGVACSLLNTYAPTLGHWAGLW